MRLIAQIPEASRQNGIEWLVLEEDREDTGGVYLYCHKLLTEESEYDSWHEDIEDAKTEAEAQWGVNKHDWIPEK